MRICMLSELFYPYLVGGAERRYYEIAVRLAKRHEVVVYSMRFDGHQQKEEHRGIEIIRTGSSHPLDKRSIPALATYFPAILKAATAQSDVIDANQGMALFSAALKPLVRKPVFATFHDIYWNKWNQYFPFPLSSIGKSMEFAWSKLPYTAVIANSPGTARKLGWLGFRKVETIPSGVDIKFINRIRAKKKKNSVVYVGRLVKYKNVDALIRAVKNISKDIPDISLRIVGSGPEESRLKSLAADLGIDAEFCGFVSEEEKFRIIKSSSVLVNPSSVEGLGLIVIEAMAAGVPVVAKKLDAYFFYNGKNMLVYGDSMEKQLMHALASAPARRMLVRNGLKTAMQYSWDNVASAVEKLYEKAIR